MPVEPPVRGTDGPPAGSACCGARSPDSATPAACFRPRPPFQVGPWQGRQEQSPAITSRPTSPGLPRTACRSPLPPAGEAFSPSVTDSAYRSVSVSIFCTLAGSTPRIARRTPRDLPAAVSSPRRVRTALVAAPGTDHRSADPRSARRNRPRMDKPLEQGKEAHRDCRRRALVPVRVPGRSAEEDRDRREAEGRHRQEHGARNHTEPEPAAQLCRPEPQAGEDRRLRCRVQRDIPRRRSRQCRPMERRQLESLLPGPGGGTRRNEGHARLRRGAQRVAVPRQGRRADPLPEDAEGRGPDLRQGVRDPQADRPPGDRAAERLHRRHPARHRGRLDRLLPGTGRRRGDPAPQDDNRVPRGRGARDGVPDSAAHQAAPGPDSAEQR